MSASSCDVTPTQGEDGFRVPLRMSNEFAGVLWNWRGRVADRGHEVVAACVTACVTIGTARDDTGRAGQTFRASAAIGYQGVVRKRLDRANSGQILRILDSIRWAKYNRLGITDAGGFQDHRHRPLGHPSASKCRLNSRVLAKIRARAGHVSPQV